LTPCSPRPAFGAAGALAPAAFSASAHAHAASNSLDDLGPDVKLVEVTKTRAPSPPASAAAAGSGLASASTASSVEGAASGPALPCLSELRAEVAALRADQAWLRAALTELLRSSGAAVPSAVAAGGGSS
jgi:hypothetical protein